MYFTCPRYLDGGRWKSHQHVHLIHLQTRAICHCYHHMLESPSLKTPIKIEVIAPAKKQKTTRAVVFELQCAGTQRCNSWPALEDPQAAPRKLHILHLCKTIICFIKLIYYRSIRILDVLINAFTCGLVGFSFLNKSLHGRIFF